MNIKKRVLQILKNIKCPVYYATNYSGEDDTFIIFYILNEKTHSACDDEEFSIYYKVHVQINSISDYDDIVDEVMKIMKANGFRRVTSAENYDVDTSFYSKSIHFEYVDYLLDDEPTPLILK